MKAGGGGSGELRAKALPILDFWSKTNLLEPAWEYEFLYKVSYFSPPILNEILPKLMFILGKSIGTSPKRFKWPPIAFIPTWANVLVGKYKFLGAPGIFGFWAAKRLVLAINLYPLNVVNNNLPSLPTSSTPLLF